MSEIIEINNFIQNNKVYKARFFPPIESGGNALTAGEAVSRGIDAVPFITGFLTNPMSWSASNTWEGLHGGMQAEKDQEKSIKAVEGAKSYAGFKGGQSSIQGITETIARYAGSQKPTFAFNVMLVALTPNYNVRKEVIKFLKGCYPKSAKWGLMEAPYGYNTAFDANSEGYDTGENFDSSVLSRNSVRGTWDVVVGKWFRCPELVLNSCNVNFSQQVTPNGSPLWAEVQLQFETWRLITANEVAAFFNV